MDSHIIFDALCNRARAAASRFSTDPSSSSSSPLNFVQQFSNAMVMSLDSTEIQAFFDFLSHQNLSAMKDGDLSPKFMKMRQSFEEEELQLSGKKPQKLAEHSGPLGAEVGVILHVQHYKPEDEDTYVARPFWDPNNQSVQILCQKGFSDTFTVFFDWHWRAAAEALGKGCPMKTWGRKLRALHDSFSAEVLDLIPCPLLVVGGACAWESYTKAIPKSSKIISFSIGKDVDVQFAFEFDTAGTTFRRIAAKIDHPSFGFRNPTSGLSAAIRLDIQCDFILWLSGREFHAKSCELLMQKHRRGKPGAAPFSTFYMYRNQQKQSGKVLVRCDFDENFLCWAGRYLKTSVDSIFESGQSLVDLIDEEHRQRRSDQGIQLQRDASTQALLQGLERTLNRRNNFIENAFRLSIRGIQVPIPYLIEDREVILSLEVLRVLLKADFADNQPSFALCTPCARPCDPAYGLRIKCTYDLKMREETHRRELWVTDSRLTHRRLCQMNSLADHLKGKDKKHTLSQPHRFIHPSLNKRIKEITGICYTVCEDAGCHGCADIRNTKSEMKKSWQVWVGSKVDNIQTAMGKIVGTMKLRNCQRHLCNSKAMVPFNWRELLATYPMQRNKIENLIRKRQEMLENTKNTRPIVELSLLLLDYIFQQERQCKKIRKKKPKAGVTRDLEVFLRKSHTLYLESKLGYRPFDGQLYSLAY